MQLFILGKNSDDKGTQLEQLTVRLMECQGFTNVRTNVQGAGGNEVDVWAEKVSQIGVKTVSTEVIAECKAHKHPIDMNDWLKFIGKYHYAKESHPQVIGLMVCLSGTNGAVVGAYKEKHAGDDTVQLIANSDLMQLMSSCFKLSTEQSLHRSVFSSYGEIYEIEALYYDKQVYWLVAYVDGHYTIGAADGSLLAKDKCEELLPMIEQYTSYPANMYVELGEYLNVRYYNWSMNVVILTCLAQGQQVSLNDLVKHIVRVDDAKPIVPQDIESALASNPFVIYDSQTSITKLKTPKEIDYVNFYRWINQYGCPLSLFETEYYQQHIDETLLSQIIDIQHGLKFCQEDRYDMLFLIKHSPKALGHALKEQEFCKMHDFAKDLPNEICKLYSDMFLRQLIELFVRDFQDPSMHKTYYNKFKLTDLSSESIVRVTIGEEHRDFHMKANLGLRCPTETEQIIMTEGIN